ncbi:MAG: hypothetical protein ACYTFG_00100 [Planctomycetota bacterium]|jgi:hypothetical protein
MNHAAFAALERSNFENDTRTDHYPEPGHFDARKGLLTVELPSIEFDPADPLDADALDAILGEGWQEGNEEPTEISGYVFEAPAEFQVCPLCKGTGTMVNPNIDCMGLSSQDFADDPKFEEAYFGGAYDVTCARCHGNRVVPSIIEPGTPDEPGPRDHDWTRERRVPYEALRRWERDEAEYQAMCRAERAMGA